MRRPPTGNPGNLGASPIASYSDLVGEVDGAAAGALSVLAAGALSAVPALSEELELPSELLPPSCDLPAVAGLAA
jgi:hypothetical protein